MTANWTALLLGEPLRLRAAARVAVCAGGQASTEADPAVALTRLSERPVTYLLVDVEAIGASGPNPADALAWLRRAHATAPQTRIVVLASPSPPACFRELLAEPWFHHLLAIDSPWFMEELAATLRKLERGAILGLASYLPWGAHIAEVALTRSDDKAPALDRVADMMGALGIGGRILRRVQDIADEMIMNAIYDAPVDAAGRPKYAHLSRQTPVALEAGEQSTLSFGSDGRTFGLAVRDPFGALRPPVLKAYIAKGLRRGEDQIDRKEGGAGLGLYLQFDFLGSMIVNLAPGRVTEFMGLLDIRGSFREIATAPKSFNCFVVD